MDAMEEEHLTPEEAETLAAIRSRKAKLVSEHRRKRKTGTNAAIVPRLADTERSRTAARMKDELSSMGLDPTAAINRARSQSRGRELRKKRARSQSASVANVADGTEVRVRSSKSRSMSRGRALSLAEPEPGKGIKDVIQRNKAIKMNDRAQKRIGRMARKGEGDRHIPDLKPKHLFSGKRPKGTADRR
jgi:nucleolar GTP-binding protein